MIECLVHRDPLLRVERLTKSKLDAFRGSQGQTYQRLRQKVEGMLRSFWEQHVEWSFFANRQCANIIS